MVWDLDNQKAYGTRLGEAASEDKAVLSQLKTCEAEMLAQVNTVMGLGW